LAWLYHDLSCDEFSQQFKARFAGLGSYSDLPAQKKKELKLVLSVACSDRFAQCQLAACQSNKDQANKDQANSEQAGSAALDSSTGTLPSQTASYAPDITDTAAANSASSVILKTVGSSEEEFNKFFRAALEERKSAVARKAAQEEQQGVEWKPFIIPE
jgi:hypothetical protein